MSQQYPAASIAGRYRASSSSPSPGIRNSRSGTGPRSAFTWVKAVTWRELGDALLDRDTLHVDVADVERHPQVRAADRAKLGIASSDGRLGTLRVV
ncbi:MAG TPA: hypothetical protein VGM69_19440 [Chloroflexota bacterium]|jgi:hypothetical protein